MSVMYLRDKNGNLIPVPTINGKDGYTPVKGTDYFTSTDINDIVNQVYAKVADGNEVEY